jgi:hypothetical protein
VIASSLGLLAVSVEKATSLEHDGNSLTEEKQMRARRRVNMIDSDRRRFQKSGVSRSNQVVERSNSMQPDTGIGKLDNRENMSSTIIVSLNINDINLRLPCNVLRDVPSLGRWWRSF